MALTSADFEQVFRKAIVGRDLLSKLVDLGKVELRLGMPLRRRLLEQSPSSFLIDRDAAQALA